MTEAAEGRGLAPRIETAYVIGRLTLHERDEPLDRLEHARDAAERQRRRAESNDLTVRGLSPPAHDLNRIGRRVWIVEALVQSIERGPQLAALESAIGNRQDHRL